MSQQHHFVIVIFDTQDKDQSRAVQEIGDYVADFLSQQPGFVRSRLFASKDGTQVVHQAEWTSETAFQTAGALAREHPDLPKLMAYTPKGLGHDLAREF